MLVHLAIAQIKPRKGDYRGNLRRLGRLFADLDHLEPRPMVLALPETALSGYFLEGGVRDNAVTAGTLARDLDAAYRAAVTTPRTLDVTLGFYEVWENKLYNSAMYVTLGSGPPQVRHVHRKMFLPTYGLFDEERFVERGRDIRAFDTSWGRAALLVCEDAWHSMTATIAAIDGAQIVFVCAAPPARGVWPKGDDVPGPASVSRRDRLTRDIADEHGVYVSLSNLVGSEGGKLFPGASMLAGPKGDVRGRAPLWEEAILSATVELADVTRATPQRRIARERNVDPIEPPKAAIHGQAKGRHRLGRRLPEQVDQPSIDIVGQLEQGPRLPVGRDALRVERGEFSLKLARDREVERGGRAGRAMTQDRSRLARVVVAVVTEVHDAPAHLLAQAPGGQHLGDQEAPREEPAGLLAKSNDRLDAHAARPGSAGAGGLKTVCSSILKAMHAAQPIRLYQR